MKTLDVKTMVSLKNILFATDFSPAADAALPYAVGIARRYGAKVHAAHVRAREVYAMAPPMSWPALADATEAQAKQLAQRLNDQLSGVPHEVVIGEGDTWEVLSNIIEKNEIDLVVIGTHGRTGFEKALLGSVAEEIFRQAPCPVLTVGPGTTVDPERALEMQEILYATDFTPESLAAAPFAISLAEEHQAHLALLHVIENPKTGDLTHPDQFVNATLRRLRDLLTPDAELWCEPKYFVEIGTPAEKILDVAKRRRADLIVLGVRRAKGHLGATTHLPWATAHKIVSQAVCPALTVRG